MLERLREYDEKPVWRTAMPVFLVLLKNNLDLILIVEDGAGNVE